MIRSEFEPVASELCIKIEKHEKTTNWISQTTSPHPNPKTMDIR
jgi:hypothetical protein